jgi:hypothetical protein
MFANLSSPTGCWVYSSSFRAGLAGRVTRAELPKMSKTAVHLRHLRETPPERLFPSRSPSSGYIPAPWKLSMLSPPYRELLFVGCILAACGKSSRAKFPKMSKTASHLRHLRETSPERLFPSWSLHLLSLFSLLSPEGAIYSGVCLQIIPSPQMKPPQIRQITDKPPPDLAPPSLAPVPARNRDKRIYKLIHHLYHRFQPVTGIKGVYKLINRL